MASIHIQEGRSNWYASFRAHGHQFFRSTGIPHSPADPGERERNQQLASARAQQMENAERAKCPIKSPSVRDFLLSFASTRSKDAETIRRNLNIVGRFLGTLAGQASAPPSIVLECHILAYRDMRGKEIEASTVNMELSLLNVAFENALSRGWVIRNPVNLIKNKLPETSSVRPLDLWQVQALAQATDILDWRTAIYIGFYTGAHLVDAAYRVWEDVGADEKGNIVMGFPGSERKQAKSVPVHPALAEHLRSLPRVNQFICPHIAELERFTADNHFAQIAAKAKLPPGTTFRCLRHTHAEQLGVSIKRLDTICREAVLGLPNVVVPALPVQLSPKSVSH